MIPLSDRIFYSEIHGRWKVLFSGRAVTQTFKTSEEAFAFLQDLKKKKLQPEYEK